VILVGGQAAGTWDKGIELFDKVPARTRKAIDERLAAVNAFLET
jgi:hypothetical protein